MKKIGPNFKRFLFMIAFLVYGILEINHAIVTLMEKKTNREPIRYFKKMEKFRDIARLQIRK